MTKRRGRRWRRYEVGGRASCTIREWRCEAHVFRRRDSRSIECEVCSIRFLPREQLYELNGSGGLEETYPSSNSKPRSLSPTSHFPFKPRNRPRHLLNKTGTPTALMFSCSSLQHFLSSKFPSAKTHLHSQLVDARIRVVSCAQLRDGILFRLRQPR